MKHEHDFLPICREDLIQRGWYYYDFLLITGDAYVDHPSFGTAIISRVLEDALALRDGKLSGEPHPTLPCRICMGKWTGFLAE